MVRIQWVGSRVSLLAVALIILTTLLWLPTAPVEASARPTGRAALAPYQLALRNAAVPASCRHAATHLDGYEKHWPNYRGDGSLEIRKAIHGHLAGRSGWVTVVPYVCNAGGVTWPELVLVYGAHARLIGSVDLGNVRRVQEHEITRRLAFADGKVRFLFDGYSGCCSMHSVHRGIIGWSSGHRTFRHQGPLVITNEDDSGVGVITGPNQASYAVNPAPADLGRFVQRQWSKAESSDPEAMCGYSASVSLERYSHRGYAAGVVSACGGYAAIWAHVAGHWRQVLGYQDYPTCGSLTALQHRALRVLAERCWKGQKAVLLGHWPRSGM